MTILRALVSWLWGVKPIAVKQGFKLAVPTTWDAEIARACSLHHLRPSLLKALIWHESRFNPNAVGDGGAARGLCQMHAAAAKDVGADWERLFDPALAIQAGAAYLGNQVKRFPDELKALMAYNQGPSVAERSNPAETAYILGMKYAGTVLSIEQEINGP